MLEIILIVAILVADQVTKAIAEHFLFPLGTSVPVFEGIFHFTSAHNSGAAWGLFQGQKWVFLILALFVIIFMGAFLIRGRKQMTMLSRITLSLLIAGALGNAIDRVIFSYVRDFLDFCLINFPVFNVADSSLSIGCVLLIIDTLFMKNRSMFDVKIRLKEPSNPPDGE